MSAARRVMMSALHPALMALALGASVAALGAGFGEPAAIAAPVLGVALVVFGLERVAPFDAAWTQDRADTRQDAALALVGLVLSQALLWGGALVGARWGVGRALWPHAWPWPAQLVVYLLIIELLGYGSHRLMHQHRALWRWHATHHRATRLYWLNAFRLHPLDAALSTLANLTWAALVGVSPQVVALAASVSAAHLLVQHSNIAVRSGWLAPWLATAEFHRWHHDLDARQAQVNYGHLTGVWDWLFGTWRRGAPQAPYLVGVADQPGLCPREAMTQPRPPPDSVSTASTRSPAASSPSQ